ncbi:ABC transporter permease [Clostridium cadaveris]|uniref:FtsX-like permease family protein n=1 Tax=Clostridium cadaveris TaxID=1529 RepID=UPI000C06C688|nr:ABC transporter permease [Clostridium cadaveris]NME64293.1 ABC transporter permease [Clostridium cadaveris]UFH65972.1 ABC transporter permease [Clostridium cadaveris]
MYYKIAIGNVKKSFKDYTIYFLTLALAVCIFYSFNSIESQKAVLELKSSGKESINALVTVIAYISVFVSIVLGSLIIYANNFLIKKRKKELGIYMVLGMGKGKISRILVTETLIVGVMSLISGLLLGIIASQGLSLLTSKLFDIPMSDYSFIISISSIGKTILYFSIMFFLVIIFNTAIISKYKIIDLLTSGRKNEEIKFKNPIVYFISFIICVISLGLAYNIIMEIGLNVKDQRFSISIILGVIGTVLFFFSLAGFVLFIVKRSKGIYFKGLNIFVVKQLNNKVNTNFISMSIICLMLFLTICVLSTGISFKNALESGLKDSTPFDATGRIYVRDGAINNIEDSLKNLGFKFEDGEEYAYYNLYESNLTPVEMFSNGVSKKDKEKLNKLRYKVSVMKLSDYNKIMKLENKVEVNLSRDESLLLSNIYETEAIESYVKDNKYINFHNKQFAIKGGKVIKDNISTDMMKNTFPTIVVNDEETKGLKIQENVININYDKNSAEKSEKKLLDLFASFTRGEQNLDNTDFIIGYTRQQIYDGNKGMTTIILFVGIYLGIVFLITSMAVLALQQLSEAVDSIDRYKALKKIGANEKMMKKTIFIQTLVYFSLPVILAFVHSVVGIKVTNNFISMFNKTNISGSAMITALIFMIVYIGYFYATYSGYKNIVKNNL